MEKRSYRKIIKTMSLSKSAAMSANNALSFMDSVRDRLKFDIQPESSVIKMYIYGTHIGTFFAPQEFFKFVKSVNQTNPETVKYPVDKIYEYIFNEVLVAKPSSVDAAKQLRKNLEDVLAVDFEAGEKVHFDKFNMASIDLTLDPVELKNRAIPIFRAYAAFLESQKKQQQMGVQPIRTGPSMASGTIKRRNVRMARLKKIKK